MAIFRPWRLIRNAFTPAQVAAMRAPLLSSPLVGRSTLGGSFRASRGFAITFRADGRAKLEQRFPAFAPFLGKALAPGSIRGAARWRAKAPNAWYLNLLLVPAGASVGRHVDGTLRGPAGQPDAVPVAVSVLYLSAPGGQLILSRGTRELGRIEPREGAMLHFRGDLDHAVAPFRGEGTRASLVLEQYHFCAEALARLPELKLDSRAGFQAYLDVHAAAEPLNHPPES
jgi:2OG-Fe(II) oxygenase superfamily